ncbi:universal stress protein [Streptomyces sp. NRRL S-4]|uniref:universal stress protein n=1 Tax=Streptomyces sp. NRRL S-4 TaxID=1519471 RepID=UPI000AD4E581|nr:universal stress protein [Streptomyces sp. NRRL S-4]
MRLEHPLEEFGGESSLSELTVLGLRGLGGFAGFDAGSVSLAVLAHVWCPLVLVRTRSAGKAARRPPGVTSASGWTSEGEHGSSVP